MESHEYAAACPKLAESNRIDPSLGTSLWLGGCYEKIDQSALAWKAFDVAARLAHEKADERESVAREHLARLASRVAVLEVDVPRLPMRHLQVSMDGSMLPVASYGTKLVLEPGTHVVAASTTVRQWTQSLQLAAGATMTITVPVLSDSLSERHTRALHQRGAGMRIVGWTLASVGLVAGAALGIGFGLDAKTKLDASNGPPYGCSGSLCDNQPGVDLRQNALNSALASTVSIIAGGVVLACGLAIVIFAPSQTRVTVSARGIAIGGSF